MLMLLLKGKKINLKILKNNWLFNSSWKKLKNVDLLVKLLVREILLIGLIRTLIVMLMQKLLII